jgi:hypothetical protein
VRRGGEEMVPSATISDRGTRMFSITSMGGLGSVSRRTSLTLPAQANEWLERAAAPRLVIHPNRPGCLPRTALGCNLSTVGVMVVVYGCG